MDFQATSATRGFNWGFSRPGRIRTSNARSKIWCVTITPQANQGARRIAYTLPLVESVSSAPALAMEEVCVAALETICLLATGLIPFGGLTPTPPAWGMVEETPRSEKKLHSLKT